MRRLSKVRLAIIVITAGAAGLVISSSASASAPAAVADRARPVAKPAAATPVNWGQSGFSKGNTGYNPYETSITTTNAAFLAYKFSIVSPPMQEPCSHSSPPLVDAGRLFVPDEGGFGVYNATTGAQEWTLREPLPAGENLTPMLAVSGSTLLVAETDCISQSEPVSTLTAYNVATGAVLWNTSADPGILTMAVDSGVLVVSNFSVLGGSAAYSIATGERLWSNDDIIAAQAVSAGGRMLVNVPDTAQSIAINVATGATLWTVPKAYYELAASTDGSKFITTDSAGNLDYLNAATGALLWSATGAGLDYPDFCFTPFDTCSPLAVDGSHVYVSHGSSLTSYALANGAAAWTATATNTFARPIVANNVVYVPVAHQGLELFNATTGAPVNDLPRFGETRYDGDFGHAVVANGWLYITNGTGRIMDAYKA
jgi:outer membrane protein assembly factor BamB